MQECTRSYDRPQNCKEECRTECRRFLSRGPN